ncbi:tripartite tricarboxylate transporter substrate binding protein [Alcaligenaceae bacterium]|nr:tripartite tricarboxylate transporter substrate binding protein [Alcaligenaceae bacterium]
MQLFRHFFFFLLALGLGWGPLAHAQDAASYPDKAVRIIVPYPAGGATDIIGRVLAKQLSDIWGQPVVVENKTGAGGVLGNEAVAKSPKDGYTILLGITQMVQAPSLYKKLPYDINTDFAPIGLVARSSDLFVVAAGTPAGTLKEFVDLVKKSPSQYNFGSYGAGSSSHIHGEMLNEQAKLDMVHVPYRGAAPLMQDLMGGQVNSAFVDSGSSRQHLGSDRFKVLAVSGTRRLPALPNVPTLAELGYHSFEPYGWFGVFVPSGTPDAIVNKLSQDLQRVLREPEVATRIEGLGLLIAAEDSKAFAKTIAEDQKVWAKVIKAANITLD